MRVIGPETNLNGDLHRRRNVLACVGELPDRAFGKECGRGARHHQEPYANRRSRRGLTGIAASELNEDKPVRVDESVDRKCRRRKIALAEIGNPIALAKLKIRG